MERVEVSGFGRAFLTSFQRIPSGYEVTETLYRSSGKAVFRGLRKADGLRVVLKCVEKPSSHARKRMDREVFFLRSLRGTGAISVVLVVFTEIT